MSRDEIMSALKEISAHKNIIQKVRELNFDKEEQVQDEINELEERNGEKLEYIILRNRYFGRPDRDTEKRIDEIEKSIKENENELGDWLAIDNSLIDWLLELDEIIRDMKTMLKKNKTKTQ